MKLKFVSSISSLIIGLSVINSPVQAVTNGSLVPNPKSDAPYVVSIWNAENSNDYKDAEFICTGTLIAPQIVLTAAHCTTYTTSYFVKVGAGALNDSTNFTAVSAVWTSPRYNPKTFVNDIGLLKLEERFENIPFPTLANPLAAKKINKYSNLRIFGWGLDQNKNLADLLRTSNLSVQDASASKTFGKYFNSKTMISAGRKIPAENVWSGACNGDSGGPLLSTIDGINVIVGVTSWGAKNCLPNKPSIFARVSYYETEVKKGISDIEAQSVSVNRTAPIATEEPSIIPNNPIPGSKLKCDPGKWKNAIAITTTWISPSRLLGSTSSEISVLSSDGGVEFKCEVVVSIAKSSVRRVLRASIIGNSVLSSNPVIAGIVDRATIKSGQTARCEGWNWKTPIDSEKVTWFTSASSQPSIPVNGRQIGSGTSITFDSNILKDENGRYLICQVTGVKNGFESHFTASKYITTPSTPVLSSVSLNAYSLTNGSTATCSYYSSGDIETTNIEWGYTSIAGYFTLYPGLSGNSIQINSGLSQQAAGKYLACRVTLINSGGEISKSASSYSSFENLPNTPTATISISGGVLAGNTAYCSGNTGYVSGTTVSYAWGKTSVNNSKNIEGQILSSSGYYTISSTTLSDLAGAFLTCVVTVTNSIGSNSGASSISIPASSVNLPTPNAPSVDAQTASNTSITATIRIPSVTGFNSSTMNAILNLINSSGCTNLSVSPATTYNCSGLSANTTYTANISISAKSGAVTTTKSSNLSFTTIGLTNATLYVCGQSCTGTLTSLQMQDYLSDKRLTEASSAPGGPITSSTCIGSGCNSGTAPVLPVSCLAGSSERTGIVANVTAQITTHFRYCSAPTDTTSPLISIGTLARTGYAEITPTSGAAGVSISVRFNASDNIGIASTNIRLINPGNVVVASATGSFIAGGTTDGVYSATIATALSGPLSGDIYQIQAQASDASGNSSGWFNLGTYTISGLLSALVPTFGSVTSNATGFTFQISNYNSSYNWTTSVSSPSQPGAGATISGTGLVTVSGMSAGASATVTISNTRTGYNTGSSSVAGSSLAQIVNNQLQIIISGPDSSGITQLGICFTNPTALSGYVNYDLVNVASGSFLKHSGTPACPAFASGSVGLRLTPGSVNNYSATASNNGVNYSASLTYTAPGTPPPTGPVISTSNVYVAVPSLGVGAQQTIEFSISSTLDVTLAQLWIYDSSSQSVTIVSGSRSAGTNLNGTWKFNFNVPPNLPNGSGGAAVSKGIWTFKGNANDSAGNGSSTGSWVNLGSFTVE